MGEQTDGQTHADRQMGGWTDTDIQMDRQTDKQTSYLH